VGLFNLNPPDHGRNEIGVLGIIRGIMKILRILMAGALFLSLYSLQPSYAEDATIKNVLISNTSNHLAVQFELGNSFNKNMEEAIETGIPTIITYFVELYQNQSWWNDKLLVSTTLLKTIKYDNLKKEYIVTANNGQENGESDSVAPTLQAAKKLMNSVEIHSLYPMWKLERNKTYYFRIKAQSKGVEPPPYIHYLLFFLKWQNFETDWAIEKFTY
jgi:hypothetical protein